MRGGLTTLWRIPAAGGVPRRIEGIGTSAFEPSVALKGHRLAFTSGFVNQNLWSLNLADRSHATGPPQAFFTSKGSNGLAHFSADGKKIAFESTRSGYNEIWTANSDGSNPVQLTFLNGDSGTPRWSYDGRYVAFDYRPKGRSEVYIADFSGAQPKLFPTNPGADDLLQSWLRDGKWLYFASIEANESPQLWKISAQGGEESLVMKQTGLECWCQLAFAPQGIYFIGNITSGNRTLFFYDFKSRERSSIAPLGRYALNPALAPDGKFLIYSQADLVDQTIMIVNNFH